MFTLKENEIVGGYRICFLIKEGMYNSTYKINDWKGSPYFMKLYDMDLVPEKLRDGKTVREIVNCRKIIHENIISFHGEGMLNVGSKSYPYLMTEYFKGKLLSEYIAEGHLFTEDQAVSIAMGVLKGLSYLHSTHKLNHNDISPRNIILDSAGGDKYIPRIIDMGHLCETISKDAPFPTEDLNFLYCSPEAVNGTFTPAGDIFSLGAVLYTMLTGIAPWNGTISETASLLSKKMKIKTLRSADLDRGALKEKGVSDRLIKIISILLEKDPEARPDDSYAMDFLTGKVDPFVVKKSPSTSAPHDIPAQRENQDKDMGVTVEIKPAKGGGFADVAGMDELKEDLKKRVIWILRDKEKAQKYRLTPPNGMILYGPPGCGKTFFAQKFAEEAGFNFSMVNGSDLGSIYVHGTQGKIASLFKEAEKNPPTILCFDEFDSFVPARGTSASEHRPEEVNEFLSQLNNCALKGIFVIGTTNRLDMIDPAVKRKGRMDLLVEIPAPDFETRKAIFKIHLKGRPLADDINYDTLAEMTDNYASSDIAFIANDAALMAALADEPITNVLLQNSIKSNKSSLPPKEKVSRIGF